LIIPVPRFINAHQGNIPDSLLDHVKEQQRINPIDLLRGVALPGILLMNVVGMALPDPAYWDPSGYGGQTGWNLGVFFINSFLTERSMRGIFSMLFGAGVILFTARKEAEGSGKSMAPLFPVHPDHLLFQARVPGCPEHDAAGHLDLPADRQPVMAQIFPVRSHGVALEMAHLREKAPVQQRPVK
jgi:hypothetical protein